MRSEAANSYLIEMRDGSYQLKLIDMDFSLLRDRRAPWHGFQAYWDPTTTVSLD